MGKLFDNLPRRFFNPLAAITNGGNQQEFYAECLLTINSLFADRTQVGRDDLKDEIVNLLLADHIQTIDETDMRETAAGRSSVFSRTGGDASGEQGQSREERMASHVISYLSDEEVGWLEEGIDSRTYSRTYMLTEQGMVLADYIQRASSMKLDEMSNYLYNTYLALDDFTRHRKERVNNNPYTLVIVNAYTNIKSLASSLKMLRRSIRRIVQKVTGKLSFQELMDNLGDYIDGDFIGEFTRLVDSENAALFRGPITAMLKKLMNSRETEEIFIRDCMKAGKEEHLTWENARVRIYEQVAFIEDFLTEGYPSIVRDIRSQMVEYIMTVRLKLKMTMDIADNAQEVIGQFIRRLSGYAAGEDTPESALRAFRILENYYVSAGSVKNGARRREKIRNKAVEQTLLTEEEILEEQERMRRMKDVPYTKDKMRLYAEKYKRNGMVRAADLPLDSKEDALADVAAAAFAPANRMDVHIDDDYIRTDRVQLRDFTLTDRTADGEQKTAEEAESEVADGR
ncbi:MAG: Wadjet anti-phage system protein JetA family protein [Bilifractor sp.]|jgi:hypothetical protein